MQAVTKLNIFFILGLIMGFCSRVLLGCIFFAIIFIKSLEITKRVVSLYQVSNSASTKTRKTMQIETSIEIENNAGDIIELTIIAEYEPFQRAQTGDYGMPTECDSEEICDITTVNGVADEKLFNAEFDVAYNYKEWYGKLTQAVHEQFEREFYAYSC